MGMADLRMRERELQKELESVQDIMTSPHQNNISQKVVSVSEVSKDFYYEADIVLENGDVYSLRFCWATDEKEEDALIQEVLTKGLNDLIGAVIKKFAHSISEHSEYISLDITFEKDSLEIVHSSAL
jgi:hypothetical protein